MLFVRLCYLVPATNEIFPKFPHFLWSWKDIGQIPRSFRINNNLHKLWSDLQNPVSSNCGVPLKERKNVNFIFALFVICFVISIYPSLAFPLSWSILLLLYMFKTFRGHKKISRHYHRWAWPAVQRCPQMDLTQTTNFWDGLFWLLYVLGPCFLRAQTWAKNSPKNGSTVVKGFYW